MRKLAVFAISAALVITAGLGGTARAAGTWHVQAGSVGIGPSGFDGRETNAFYPAAITVHPGDTVVFAPATPHTVTFNPPAAPFFTLFTPSGATTLETPTTFVNSGFIGGAPGAPPFILKVGASLPEGEYVYFCMLHIGMKGEINVVDAADELPNTDAEYTAEAQRRISADLDRLDRVADRAAERVAENNAREDDEPTVLAGAGNKRGSNLRFYPSSVTIHVGQAVTWTNKYDPTEAHTVSFGAEPGDDFLPTGPPPYTFNGTGSVASGFLITKAQFDYLHLESTPLVQTTEFKVTFSAVGTFPYICTLHDQGGMKGVVVVLP